MIKSRLKFQPSSNNRIVPHFRTGILFAFCTFFFLGNTHAQGDFFKNVSLIRIFNRLEKTYNVHFSYDVSLVKKREVAFFQLSNKNLKTDLIALLRDANLGFDRLGDDIIIKRVPSNYYQKFNQNICGLIINSEDGLPLGHASISIANTNFGETADSLGHFSLDFPVIETDYLEVNYIGYETKRIKLTFFLNQPCKTIFLSKRKMEVPLVIVREDLNIHAGIKVSNVEPDVIIIRPDKMTGTGGIDPKDVFGTLQQLPGVNSANESATSLNVRGGGAGQNLVLYDNIPLYHYGHIFGKVSAFNSDLIEEVRFNKSGFSSQEGGRVSSIIDIRSKKEIPEEIGIKANIGLLSAGLSGSLPFAKNKAALFLGYRKSIFEKSALNKKLLSQVFQGTRVVDDAMKVDSLSNVVFVQPKNRFYDFFAKAIWNPTEGDILGLSALKMGDALSYRFANCSANDCYKTQDNLNLSNAGFNASWQHYWQPNFFSSLVYTYSDFDKSYNFLAGADSLQTLNQKKNTINDVAAQWNNQWEKNYIRVNFGAQYKKTNLIIGNIKQGASSDTLVDNSEGITNSLFVDYRHDLGEKFHLFIGARLSSYSLLEKGLFLEPRFSVSSNPNQYLKIRMNGGVYYQTMNQILSLDGLSEKDATWVLAKDIEGTNLAIFSVQKNTQLSVGLSYQRAGWQANFDVYDKLVVGIPSQVVELQGVGKDELGELKASGLEVGIQKWGEKYFSVLSYSRGNAEYEFPSFNSSVTASYHQRHQLSLLQGIKYKNLSATVNWKWKSGLPYSDQVGILSDSIGLNKYDYSIEYKGLNNSLLRSYNRFDMTLSYEQTFSWGNGTFTISAFNIFNRKNVLNRRYDLEISDAAQAGLESPVMIKEEQFGLPFTPNVSVLFEFGFGKTESLKE